MLSIGVLLVFFAHVAGALSFLCWDITPSIIPTASKFFVTFPSRTSSFESIPRTTWNPSSRHLPIA